mgnify:CR=1 FL=1
MIETLRCPSCRATYGIGPERIHPGIRRAQCVRCPEIFSIEEEVRRLVSGAPIAHPAPEASLSTPEVAELDLSVLEPMEEPLAQEATLALPIMQPIKDLDGPFEALPFAEPLGEELLALEVPPAFEEAGILPEDVQATSPGPESDLGFLEPVDAPQDAPSLTLTDLEGTDEEILDKTMLMEIVPPAPQEGEGFSSAKDAISKILGGLEAPAGHAHPHAGRIPKRQGVDMEATLSALDQSLGGTVIPGDPLVPQAPKAPGTATTVRISIDDIRAAIDSVPLAAREIEPEPAVQAPAPAAPAIPAPAPAPTVAPAVGAPDPAQDPNLLKVQVGNEVYTNITVDQITAWIQQGRILENHQVARQFSDHWIDAVKVPALRPVFDRVRRERIEAGAPQSVLDSPQKKSLFGGLFGR